MSGHAPKHEVLRGATAIKRCFRVALSSAKQDQRRGAPEDLEIWPFSPGPRTAFRLMIVGILLGAVAIVCKALNTFDHAQGPGDCSAYGWRGRLHSGVQQFFQQGSVDRIGTVLADGPPGVNGFEYIHDASVACRCDAKRSKLIGVPLLK